MAEKNNNYILIGMPGSGKSTIGVLLAKALGYDFVDTDLVIQQKGGGLLKRSSQESGMTDSNNWKKTSMLRSM